MSGASAPVKLRDQPVPWAVLPPQRAGGLPLPLPRSESPDPKPQAMSAVTAPPAGWQVSLAANCRGGLARKQKLGVYNAVGFLLPQKPAAFESQ